MAFNPERGPEQKEHPKEDCRKCGGRGKNADGSNCGVCGGTGKVTVR